MQIFKEIAMIPAYAQAIYTVIVINVIVFVFCVLSIIPSVFVLLLFENPISFYLDVTEDVRKTYVSWETIKGFIKNKREQKFRKRKKYDWVQHVNCRCALNKSDGEDQ